MATILHVLFDLDDTLYTNTSGLFAEVGQRIERWTSEALRIDLEAARALRRRYYAQYGTTMAGLRKEHPGVDLDAYLDYVHDIDVDRFLQPTPNLAAMLAELPTPKSIFTNSIMSWAERITRRLGVRGHFEHIFDVRAVGYRSKPDPYAYACVLDRLGLLGEACVMVDDQASYLAGAAKQGMTTILVRPGARATGNIDYAVDHILKVGPILAELLQRA